MKCIAQNVQINWKDKVMVNISELGSFECLSCGRTYDKHNETDMEQYNNHGKYCDETKEG